ncbi:TetR family transcriptional regulator [Clostridium zeae]|uniref:TetR family transcriptional regulator n=1 Tax=Clostridium zeae TaxID=2759022 RepID=A0ABQ1E5Y5_9CLOT|nr:TetR/AcrR family transcriptional regulator [Clostridium zeae]GFZ30145.1 TetR family transcriptional regulator [Clostridium zeae]
MNEKFFKLPQERQSQIINSALKVFSKASYYQTSTLEIAREAGISKGLLFYYFKNKKELYLFLYEYCVKLVIEELDENRSVEERDFFEILLNSQRLKCKLMKKYRYIYEFIVKVYKENDEEVIEDIVRFSEPLINYNYKNFFEKIDRKKFREGVDIPLLFQSLQWCAEGFMRSALSTNKSIDEIDLEFEKILELYKQNFYKEEFICTTMNTEIGKITQ